MDSVFSLHGEGRRHYLEASNKGDSSPDRTMKRSQHNRAFLVAVIWTLALLLLGSIVHATNSSLACPDWPTCFGTMMPEMTGGVFWEHLHRLVAGGLILLWILATYLAWGPGREQPGLRMACLAGLALLLVQAILGGVTVLLLLPDAISTSHLGLALLFLALATVLTLVTSPHWGTGEASDDVPTVRQIRTPALLLTVLVFLQSLLGGWVRHSDAGMACPDVPLCLGRWIPAFQSPLVTIHFAHRAIGVMVGVAALALGGYVLAKKMEMQVRWIAGAVIAAVTIQILLGFTAVATQLSVVPVSLHTLMSAILVTLLVVIVTYTWEPVGGRAAQEAITESDG